MFDQFCILAENSYYDCYDIFFNTSNKFPNLLTHQHTYNTQLTKQLMWQLPYQTIGF